jgi:Flp pilus assembly protein TadG
MCRKSYRKRQEGVVAIEFAMLGIPFFMLLMGILETSMFFAAARFCKVAHRMQPGL